jgi:hypothetical protein
LTTYVSSLSARRPRLRWHLIGRLLDVWRHRPWLAPVLVTYTAVFLFAIAFVFLGWSASQHMWPAGWPAMSRSDLVIAAALVAAPLLIGVAWHRMTGFKFAGIEVSLAAAQATPDRSMSADMMKDAERTPLGGSEPPDIELAIAKAAELLEVDLGIPSGWWSTRLYLLAALAEDYGRVARILFVDNRPPGGGVFVGIAKPAAVRRAMASTDPRLEKAYRQARANVVLPAAPTTDSEVDAVIKQLSDQMAIGGMPEFAIKQVLDPLNAAELLPQAFDADAVVQWDNESDVMLQYLVVRQPAAFVVVLRNGRVNQVIDRCTLVTTMAKRDLQSRLQG